MPTPVPNMPRLGNNFAFFWCWSRAASPWICRRPKKWRIKSWNNNNNNIPLIKSRGYVIVSAHVAARKDNEYLIRKVSCLRSCGGTTVAISCGGDGNVGARPLVPARGETGLYVSPNTMAIELFGYYLKDSRDNFWNTTSITCDILKEIQTLRKQHRNA